MMRATLLLHLLLEMSSKEGRLLHVIFWPDFTIVCSAFLLAAEEFLYHMVMEIASVLSAPQKAVRTGVLRLAYLSLRRKGEASEGLHCNASHVNGPHQVPDVPEDMGE